MDGTLSAAVLSWTCVGLSSLGNSIQVNTVCPFVAACETTTFPIYTEDLVGMPEDDCNNDEGYKLPYARGQPFGIRWQDDTPLNCSIATLTIAIQAGFSCTGSYGQTSLNSYITPSRYRFPYENEYNETCYCQVTYSPLQVLFLVSYLPCFCFNFPNSSPDHCLEQLCPQTVRDVTICLDYGHNLLWFGRSSQSQA